MDMWTLTGTVIGAVMGSQVLVALIQNTFRRSKTKAEADAIATDNAIKLVELLTNRVDKLEADIEMYRKENLELHKELIAVKTELNILKSTNPR